MKRAVHIPDLGDFHDVEVLEVVAKPGDILAPEAPIVTLESDKAAMDVPAPFAGKVLAIHIKAGDRVNQGDLVADLETDAASDEAAPPTPPAQSEPQPNSPAPTSAQPASTPPPPAPAKPPATESAPTPSPPPSPPAPSSPLAHSADKPHAGPGVRRFARELGVDLRRVSGSGPKGRVLKTDVESHVKAAMASGAPAGGGAGLPEAPAVDFSQFGEVETRPLSRIRKLSGANLRRNWIVAPHVTQHEEADVTDMEAFRKSLADEAKKQGYKMTPLAFLVKAAALALREFPEFNASLDPSGENLILKKYCAIGVAVDTPQGLVVPVIRDADKKGVTTFARELAELSARAREGKLKREEMQGGCFTISSLGGIGGTAFTPIINVPEVAILGVSRAQMKPHWDGEKFIPRLMMPLSLSYDHRVIDGAHGARFIVRLRALLSDIRRLAL